MTEITNVQVVDLSNSMLRIVADKMLQLDSRIEIAVGEYNQRDAGTIIDQAGAGNLVADGSETDGRTRVTGGDIYNFITLLNDFETWLGTNNRRDVLMKWQVNGLG